MAEVQFAKKHIRNRFSLMVMPYVTEGLWSVYDNAKVVCEKNGQIDQTLKTFQNLLTYIPKWDDDRLNAEVSRIQTASGCSYLEEMLTGVLVTYLRAFASVQYKSTEDNIEVEFERPPLPRFIHALYKEAARQSWQNAYLFKTYSTSTEQQARNRKELDLILDGCLDTTLDSFLPWKSIVENYFKEPTHNEKEVPIKPTEMEEDKPRVKFEDSESDSDSESESESEKGGPPIQLSDELTEIEFESLDKEPESESEEVGELVPSEEALVLKL
uniref:Uncharacterized protein n=1 Tax=viral metagenome TaxID=1070528 RepID=A0A6C0I5V0_9ZZZZ